MVTTSLMKILNFFQIFEILKCCEQFWKYELLKKKLILEFLNIFKFWNFMNENWNFWISFLILKFKKNSEFSLIDDEIRVFRINIKLLSNPVANWKSAKTIHIAGP